MDAIDENESEVEENRGLSKQSDVFVFVDPSKQ